MLVWIQFAYNRRFCGHSNHVFCGQPRFSELCPVANWPGRDAEYCRPYSAEIKNYWNCTSAVLFSCVECICIGKTLKGQGISRLNE
jgi:hypothetical protein